MLTATVVRCRGCGSTSAATMENTRTSARRKLIDGERHTAECIAGRSGVNGRTLLVGYAEFNSIDKVLLGTLNANYREEAKRDRKITASVLADVTNMTSYVHRNVAAAATAVAAAIGSCLNHTCAEDDGINGFNHRYGKIVAYLTAYGSGAEAVYTCI